ncbi:MAG TPA: C39 family peptidase [Ktedonobacteraceae bacterium]|nr:C39 family peptidase [Ktedonobacteraceae bacterium]
MLVGSSWCKLRRWLTALLFFTQYRYRESLFDLRQRVRTLSRMDIYERARSCLNKLYQTIASCVPIQNALQAAKKALEGEQCTAVVRTAREKLESERLRAALRRTKEKLEQLVFTEEEEEIPPRLLDQVSRERLEAAWHTSEMSNLQRLGPETLKAAERALETAESSRPQPGTFGIVWPPLKVPRTPQQWRVVLIALGFVVLALLALLAAIGLGQRALPTFKTKSISVEQQTSAFDASKALVRVSQLDPSEYASQDEYDTWAYSACSAAAMAEVFDAYGHHYRITDVLKVESAIGEITPQLGLLTNAGIAKTAAKFGFQTTWGNNWTLNQVLENANAGRPVIVGWPPSLYPDGHIVVVVGGDAHNVYLADSSVWNRHVISAAQFMQWWGGFAAVVTPA